MLRPIHPKTVAKPASRYAHAIAHPAGAERVVVSGQVGMTLEGTFAKGLQAQMDQSWRNLFGVIEAAGFERTDIVKMTIFIVDPGATGSARGDAVKAYRETRDRVMAGHAAATTFLFVSGLANPEMLFEVEAEAVKG